jgi:hypothetical protein
LFVHVGRNDFGNRYLGRRGRPADSKSDAASREIHFTNRSHNIPVKVLLMPSLNTLPLAFRALFSSFLVIIGIGYLTALSLLYFVDIEPHQKLGQGLVQGISQNYHGAPRGTRMRAALMGPMAKKLSAEERNRIFQWMDKGALADDFASVEPIFSEICSDCHSPEKGLPIPAMTNYSEVARVVRGDRGPSISQLARVSHIHLFGISIIFLLTGAIFSLSETPTWLRVSLLVLPYVTIVMDVGSWWATKYLDPVFAYIVIGGGALMGLSLASQILISLWEMWVGSARKRAAPVLAAARAS